MGYREDIEALNRLGGLFTVGAVLDEKEVRRMQQKPSMEDVKKALMKIVLNREEKALNYAVNYARYGIGIQDPSEMRTQVLYVLNNITRWRGEVAKSVRTTLKAFAGIK